MRKIISPALRKFPLGLFTRGNVSEIPVGACVELLNLLYKYEVWRRRGGSAKYNSSAMHATEEVRGGFVFNDGTTYAIVSICNSSLYATTGDGSMGSALTAPEGGAVTFANGDLDVYAAQYMNRLHLVNGDATDYLLVYDSNGDIIDYARADGLQSGLGHGWQAIDATNGTTTIDDATLTEANDWWNGLPIYIRDATDGQYHKTIISDFDATNDRITLAEAPTWIITTDDVFHMGSWDDYDIAGDQHSYPKGLKFLTVHMDMLFGAVGSTLWWTDPFDPDRWDPKVGVNYKYIGRDDEDQDITAIASLDDKIVVFKPHNIYVIRTIGDKDLWPVIRITGLNSNKGCVWHKTAKRGFGGIIYMSWDGVYVLHRSLNVHCVSRNIAPTMVALAQSLSNPGGKSVVEKQDTSKADFEAGETQTKIDTATVAGTFRVDLTTEAVDTEYTSGGDSYRKGSEFTMAQSFKPTIDCICTKIEIYISKKLSPPDLTVYLKADNGNEPGVTLASAVISAGDVGTDYAYEIANITDTNLIADTRYWIYLLHPGDSNNYYRWVVDETSPTYTNGNAWLSGNHSTDVDFLFKIYEQHYESSPEFISQIFDLGTTSTGWGTLNITETLNGCSNAWYVRADDKSDMADNPAWVAIEPGATIACDLERYFEYRCVSTPTNVATPVVNDVTMVAYLGTESISPCAYVWNKAYWLSVQDIGGSVNNCVYWLDEEAIMYEEHERWSKFDGLYINEFLEYNDQLLGTSVGGTGKGGFLYYLDTGTKDIGSDFTARLISKEEDSGTPEQYDIRDREKIFKKIFSKYVSQQNASLYYKIESGDWSSAITLSPHADVAIARDFFNGVQRGKRMSLKIEQTVADSDFQIMGFDIVFLLARIR